MDSATVTSSATGLWAATALGGLAQSLSGSAGALLARQLSGSDAVGGLPQAALVAGSALAAVLLSALTRRWGRGPALAVGAAAAATGCAGVVAAALAGSLTAMLVATLLVGAGTTAVMLARYAAADLVPGDPAGAAADGRRARAMGGVLVATAVGAVIGPVLLAPAAAAAGAAGLPALCGPYVAAGIVFAAAATVLTVALPGRLAPGRLALGRLAPGRPAPGRLAPGRLAPGRPAPGGRAGVRGPVVLAVTNLVMVAVMTMAPVHLVHAHAGLGLIGIVVSLHVAAMFGPAPLSGRLVERIGAGPAAAAAGAVLGLATVLVAGGAGAASAALIAGLVLLGAGWNLGLVSGSALLIAGVPPAARPRREAWGEVGMGAAAAAGAAGSGSVVAAAGYAGLAWAAAAIALTVLPITVAGLRRPTTTAAADPIPAPASVACGSLEGRG